MRNSSLLLAIFLIAAIFPCKVCAADPEERYGQELERVEKLKTLPAVPGAWERGRLVPVNGEEICIARLAAWAKKLRPENETQAKILSHYCTSDNDAMRFIAIAGLLHTTGVTFGHILEADTNMTHALSPIASDHFKKLFDFMEQRRAKVRNVL